MEITYSKTREQFPLSKKKIIKKTLKHTIGWLIFLLIVLYIPLLSGLYKSVPWISEYGAVIATIFLIVYFLVSLSYQYWYWLVYFYDLTPDYIQIKKGPITPKEITIPYERIQDVYVDQDIYDRIFGLYDVHLSSATGTSGMEAHIDGVEKTAAEGLRSMLLKTVQDRISKARAQSPSSPN